SPGGYGYTLRYSVYPSTTRAAIGTTICHAGTGSLCRTNTSMTQPTVASTYTTSRISVPMVPDHRKLLKAAGDVATPASMPTMTPAIATITRVAQTARAGRVPGQRVEQPGRPDHAGQAAAESADRGAQRDHVADPVADVGG